RAAEPRLIRAVAEREFGFTEDAPAANGKPANNQTPLSNSRLVPNWLTAAALLRRVGSEACIDALLGLLTSHSPIAVNTGTTVALTLEQLALRGALSDGAARLVRAMLDRMPSLPLVGVIESPARPVGPAATKAIRGETSGMRITTPEFGKTR